MNDTDNDTRTDQHPIPYVSTVSIAGGKFTPPVVVTATTTGEPESLGEPTDEGVGYDAAADDDYEYLSAYEDLVAAYNGYFMAAEIDIAVLGSKERQRIERMRKMSLRIAFDCIKEIYDNRFPKDE